MTNAHNGEKKNIKPSKAGLTFIAVLIFLKFDVIRSSVPGVLGIMRA